MNEMAARGGIPRREEERDATRLVRGWEYPLPLRGAACPVWCLKRALTPCPVPVGTSLLEITVAMSAHTRLDGLSRDYATQSLENRRRASLVIAMRYLQDAGFYASYDAVKQEAGVSLDQLDVADNVDLVSIVREYEDAYEAKFGKKPKLIRRAEYGAGGNAEEGTMHRTTAAAATTTQRKFVSGAAAAAARRAAGSANQANAASQRASTIATEKYKEKEKEKEKSAVANLSVVGSSSGSQAQNADHDNGSLDVDDVPLRNPLRLPTHLAPELVEAAMTVARDAYVSVEGTAWDDVKGCEDAKMALHEAVVWPLRYPQLFTDGLTPWRGVLLHGPPGTGKTMLARAAAATAGATFLNVSASSLTSKWRGESEKAVRALFALARHNAPCVVFLDECDAFMDRRGGDDSGDGGGGGKHEHEASRRVKSEFLMRMDGLAEDAMSGVLVLAATNLPWELDRALLRRLERRVHVPLPDAEARRAIAEDALGSRTAAGKLDLTALADATDGLSGADVRVACRMAMLRPVRRAIEAAEASGMPPSPAPVSQDDLMTAAHAVRPTVDVDAVARHEAFSEALGNLGGA